MELPEHPDNIFRAKYEASESDWGNSSGPGSDPYYTIEYRGLISRFVRLNEIKSVVDIGCGDWAFSKFIDFGSASYVGLDVVESVVKRNISRYSTGSVQFYVMPRDSNDIPSGDLLLMKDVLQHLSDEDIILFRDHVVPKFKYCLITNSFEKLQTARNTNIETGGFRCVDLRSQPYNMSGCYILEFNTSVWERVRVLLIERMI